MGRGKTGNFWKAAAILLGCALLTGCGNTGEVDDYATNIGYEARGSNGTTQVVQSESGSSATTQTAGIPKEEIKVGVIHLSDPADGSGYTYTHDLGIQGMQQNLGLDDDQIVRKINVNDGDAQATRQAIQECIDEGCNIIFTTSWGYMETTAEMAEEYPDVYFSHGTGYLSNLLALHLVTKLLVIYSFQNISWNRNRKIIYNFSSNIRVFIYKFQY